jgi:hypothetical protein
MKRVILFHACLVVAPSWYGSTRRVREKYATAKTQRRIWVLAFVGIDTSWQNHHNLMYRGHSSLFSRDDRPIMFFVPSNDWGNQEELTFVFSRYFHVKEIRSIHIWVGWKTIYIFPLSSLSLKYLCLRSVFILLRGQRPTLSWISILHHMRQWQGTRHGDCCFLLMTIFSKATPKRLSFWFCGWWSPSLRPGFPQYDALSRSVSQRLRTLRNHISCLAKRKQIHVWLWLRP